jgi:predicted transposase YbfD/YdcC
MKGYTAMAGWVADVPEGVVTDLYLRAGALPAGRPSRSTIWRVCTDADVQALDAAIGTWLSSLASEHPDDRGPGDPVPGQAMMQVRLDGKTVRGATDAEGNAPHLLAALAGPPEDPGRCVVVAQAEVSGAKTNEPATAREILGAIDIDGKTVTADALHTVKATARLIHRRGGQFVLPVKQNRQALFDALDALPWQQVPISHTSVHKGHGRITRRTIQVAPAPPDLPFPHVNQVYLVERYVSDTAGNPMGAVAQLGVASHTTTQATPADLARYVQGQWAIESLHWIRDTCY